MLLNVYWFRAKSAQGIGYNNNEHNKYLKKGNFFSS